jgi:signal transduction histidine kinase
MPELEPFRDAGVRCICVVPLASRDGLMGALNLHFFEVQDEDRVDMDIVFDVANQLTIAMQQIQLNDQVKQHAEELEQRVAERTAELEAANRVKDEFVSNVSHELRTPITSLKLYHDLLVLRPDRFETYVATLRRETDRLNDLIENLLTLSRLDQDRVVFNIEPVDFNTLIEEYIEDREPLALDRDLQLSAETVPNLPTVDGDRKLLGQALSVLLTNAFNYTPPGGHVVLSTHVSQFDGRVWTGFCVRDTGLGIPPEEHEKLFTRFYRGKVGRESGVSGTGLGLAIAHKIVTKHDGRITLNSEGVPGHGATFCVWLPTEL